MGGKQSKHVFTNDLQLPPEEKDDTKCCLFCPIPKASSSSSPDTTTLTPSRNSSKNNLSRPNSNTALYKDEFGTPLPDTPIFARRLRDAAFDDQDNDDEEGEKTHHRATGGSYIEGVSSSRYGGLEKETAAMFEHENVSNGGRQIHNKKLPTAGIYEGPVSACTIFLVLDGIFKFISCVTFYNLYTIVANMPISLMIYIQYSPRRKNIQNI